MSRTWVAIGATLAFLAVAFGAFGAHALRDRLTPDLLAIFQTGVQYQFMHAIAILIIAALPRAPRHCGWLFLAGVLIFSGSLYALALTGVRSLGAITPLGGVCFLAGWLVLLMSALKKEHG